MTNIRIFVSDSQDPWFNLATEDWLFQELAEFEQALFLWRNRDTVVIGRSQNPWLECHLPNMQRDNVHLARRQSGGGAVFHDLGNTNFTFLSRRTHYSRQNNFAIILSALAELGIQAQLSGRNDLVLMDQQGSLRKISGSAFKERHDRAFHHGTLLLCADMTKLQNYLNPNEKKLAAKGVKSVRSRVMNLAECYAGISHAEVCSAIIRCFAKFYQLQNMTVEYLQTDNLLQQQGLQAYYQKMQDWDWIYGQTLEFTHRFEERFTWGMIDIHLRVDQAIIQDVRVYSDSLYPDLIEALTAQLKSCPYVLDRIAAALTQLRRQLPTYGEQLNDLLLWVSAVFK